MWFMTRSIQYCSLTPRGGDCVNSVSVALGRVLVCFGSTYPSYDAVFFFISSLFSYKLKCNLVENRACSCPWP